jgi:hypothetical protein
MHEAETLEYNVALLLQHQGQKYLIQPAPQNKRAPSKAH